MSDNKHFLLESGDEQQEMLENLKRLLASTDATNAQLALTLLKNGGVPDSLHHELLIVSKTQTDASIREGIRRLLEKHAAPEWQALAQNGTSFANIVTAKEKDIRDKMSRMAKEVGWEGTALLGCLLFERFGKGLSFVLTYPKQDPHRLKALQMLTEGDVFDFHRGVGYYNWKNEKPEAIMLSQVQTGIPFPGDHPDAARIRAINFHNCKFDSVAPDVQAFANVEEMDLSVNNLKGLPPAFAKLTKLRKLNLSFNRLTKFPDVLLKMKNLEELDLRYNGRFSYYSVSPTPLPVPDGFYAEVPGCRVVV